MSTSSEIPDDALVLRHIPGGTNFQQPPFGHITSNNFKLRLGETGISVSLSRPERVNVDASSVLQRLQRSTESRIAVGLVGAIRELGFEVLREPIPDDPQHALIIPQTASLNDPLQRKRLASRFQYV